MEGGSMGDRVGHRLAGLGIVLALLLAGCGSDDGAGVRNGGGQSASGGGSGTASGSGTGTDAHELVVVRADDPAKLPLAADGTVDEGKLPEGAFVGEIEPFPAKQHCTGTFQLAAGRYALFCNILETEADGTKENHYANGMRSAFEVRG